MSIPATQREAGNPVGPPVKGVEMSGISGNEVSRLPEGGGLDVINLFFIKLSDNSYSVYSKNMYFVKNQFFNFS